MRYLLEYDLEGAKKGFENHWHRTSMFDNLNISAIMRNFRYNKLKNSANLQYSTFHLIQKHFAATLSTTKQLNAKTVDCI